MTKTHQIPKGNHSKIMRDYNQHFSEVPQLQVTYSMAAKRFRTITQRFNERCGMITQPLVVTATSWSSFHQYMTLHSITLQRRLKSKRESKWMSQIWSKKQRFTYLAGQYSPLKTKCFTMNAGGNASKTYKCSLALKESNADDTIVEVFCTAAEWAVICKCHKTKSKINPSPSQCHLYSCNIVCSTF